MQRDWIAARAKVDKEAACRVCGREDSISGGVRLEAAHIIGREYDRERGRRPESSSWQGATIVVPDRIVPLCGPATDSDTCHGKYDAHRLDLLPYLTREEETQAVADVGLENARIRLCPSAYPSKAVA